MPIPTYTPGYPPDGSTLGQTKATIRNNLDGTFQTLAVDHINNNGQPGSQPAGYHTVIHQVTQTNVSTVTGYNQIFSGVPGTLVVNGVTTKAIPSNGDQQLYSLTGGGVLSQLTGFSANTKGYVWAGGILIQWGADMATNSGNPVSYAIPFPTAVFAVTCTVYNSGGTPRYVSEVSAASLSGFTAISQNTSNPIYFIAIGN
jgi:hypothetical protein